MEKTAHDPVQPLHSTLSKTATRLNIRPAVLRAFGELSASPTLSNFGLAAIAERLPRARGLSASSRHGGFSPLPLCRTFLGA